MRIPLAKADHIAHQFLTSLRPWTLRTSPVGSIRRREQTIGDIDLLIEIHEEDFIDVQAAVRDNARIFSGDRRKLRLTNIFGDPTLDGDLWICYPPRNFFVLQALFTGVGHSQLLREKLLANGVRRPHAEIKAVSEQEVFDLAGVPYLPPEQRR